MVDRKFLEVLKRIVHGLHGKQINWAIVGSLALAIRGAPVKPHDIDIMTDRAGAYEIERVFSEHVTRKVSLRSSDRIQSHFGALELDGIKIEIMGDFRHRREDGGWDDPPDLRRILQNVPFDDLQVPLLQLEWSRESYRRLGRPERVAMIDELIHRIKE